MFKEILDQQQLEPRNCVCLDDIEDNTIAAETLDVKAQHVKKRSDVLDVLKKINKQKTLYHLCGRGFFVNKILQNDIYILHLVIYMI